MAFLQGQFLVASPHLCDPNFFRAIVLMVQHDEEGAFGLILNRVLDRTVTEVWELLAERACECSLPLHVGGPVEGPIVALHDDPMLAEQEVVPGVFFAAEQENLDRLVRQDEHRFRIFCGYAGWGAGQLEGEMEAGGWLVAPASSEDIFCDVDRAWENVSKKINLDILATGVRLRHVPDDPSWN